MKLQRVLDEIKNQKNYSFAGRLTCSSNAQALLSKQPSPKDSGIDMSRLLSVEDVQNTLDAEAEDPPEHRYLVSSPRDHPSVRVKKAYITLSERKKLFDTSLAGLLKAPIGQSLAADETSTSKMQTGCTTSSPASASLSPVRGAASPAGRARKNNTSSFLAITREQRAREPLLDGMPAVGHYHPRYTVVEQPLTFQLTIPKASRDLNGQKDTPPSSHTPTKTPLRTPPKDDVTPPDTATGSAKMKASSTGAKAKEGGTKASTAAQKDQSTWAFRTKGRSVTIEKEPYRGEDSRSASMINYNEFTIRARDSAKVSCDMSKATGRDEAPRSYSADLLYNVRSPTPKQRPVDIKLSKQTGRSHFEAAKRLPHGAAQVERGRRVLYLDNYDRFKYRSESCLTDLSAQLARDKPPVGWSPTHTSELPASSSSMTIRGADLSLTKAKGLVPLARVPGRKPPKPALGAGLEYDLGPAHNLLERRGHTVSFVRCGRTSPPPSDAPAVIYDIDYDKLCRPLARSIRFDQFESRHQRENRGRDLPLVMHETSFELDMSRDPLQLPVTKQPHLGGDPHMATHSSRTRRERAINPPANINDLMYYYELDPSPLRHGAVQFDKMVSRERHGGSHYAKVSKKPSR